MKNAINPLAISTIRVTAATDTGIHKENIRIRIYKTNNVK